MPQSILQEYPAGISFSTLDGREYPGVASMLWTLAGGYVVGWLVMRIARKLLVSCDIFFVDFVWEKTPYHR